MTTTPQDTITFTYITPTALCEIELPSEHCGSMWIPHGSVLRVGAKPWGREYEAVPSILYQDVKRAMR